MTVQCNVGGSERNDRRVYGSPDRAELSRVILNGFWRTGQLCGKIASNNNWKENSQTVTVMFHHRSGNGDSFMLRGIHFAWSVYSENPWIEQAGQKNVMWVPMPFNPFFKLASNSRVRRLLKLETEWSGSRDFLDVDIQQPNAEQILPEEQWNQCLCHVCCSLIGRVYLLTSGVFWPMLEPWLG